MARLFVAIAFALIGFVGPLVAPFAPRVHALTFAVAVLFVIWPALSSENRGLSGSSWLAVGLLGLLLTLGVSFSPEPWRACEGVAYLVLVVLGSLLFWKARMHWPQVVLLPVAWLGLAGVLVAEYLSRLWLNRTLSGWLGETAPLPYELDRAIVAAVLLLWPVLALVAQRAGTGLALLLLCVVIVPVSFTMSQASLLGLALGLTVVVAAVLFANVVKWALPSALVVIVMIMPLLCLWAMDNMSGMGGYLWIGANGDSRLEIWSQVAAKVMERPLWGHGIEAARHIPFIAEKSLAHPHNGVLQVWLEFGFLGAAALAALLYVFSSRLALLAPAYRPFAQGALVCWVGIFCVSYNIWQAWWMALSAIMLLLFLQRVRQS